MKKKKKIWLVLLILVVVLIMAAFLCVRHYIGFPESVSVKGVTYTEREMPVTYDGITLYGKVLIPEGDGPFPMIIYAHGAESDHKADMTTLRSLAKSGIACYTFDFYGWTKRSTGPDGTNWFRESTSRDYQGQLLRQADGLDAVIEFILQQPFVDTEQLFLLGSSMGGATVATAAVSHNENIRGIILQYPAINLNPDAMVAGAVLDVNGYTGPVLILQGTEDVIVPQSMSEKLTSHYNTLYADHAKLIIYDGEPHVFTGAYKVQAAKDIFQFISEMSD